MGQSLTTPCLEVDFGAVQKSVHIFSKSKNAMYMSRFDRLLYSRDLALINFPVQLGPHKKRWKARSRRGVPWIPDLSSKTEGTGGGLLQTQ